MITTLETLCSDLLRLLKENIKKIFCAHQEFSKIFHDPINRCLNFFMAPAKTLRPSFLKTSAYKEINDFSYNHTLNKNISNFSSKFGIENVFIKYHRLPNKKWLPKMIENPIKPRFFIVSPESSIKPTS